MNHRRAWTIACACGVSHGAALGQDHERAVRDVEPAGFCDVAAAALAYDGSSSWSGRGQDYESIFDAYDVFIIEDFTIDQDHALGEFRTIGFGNADPRGTTDVGVRILENNGSGLPGSIGYTGRLRMMSVPGAGFYNVNDFSFDSNFGGQCLVAGSYFIVFAVRLDFFCFGNTGVFMQRGEHSAGGGEADNAWQWNPGNAFGLGTHFPAIDPDLGPSGINFELCGEPATCDLRFCQADFTGSSNSADPSYGRKDGDVDADDLFLFLDLFASNDARVSLDEDAFIDADDFFLYLDWFVQGCD